MNYFQIQEEKNRILNGCKSLSDYPILKTILEIHLDRALIIREQGQDYNDTSMLLVNFQKYISLFNHEYLARMILYKTISRARVKDIESILLSPTMCTRFSSLVQRLEQKNNVKYFITAFNNRPVTKVKDRQYIKIHNVIYTRRVTKQLLEVFEKMKKAVVANDILENLDISLLKKTEDELSRIVSNLRDLLEREKITQYLSAFSSRFDDILIGFACRELGIPTKELAHGINTYNLHTGDTLTPKNFDYLLVWHEQMKKAILEYGSDSERIQVVGYPKLNIDESQKIQNQYKEKNKIIYFSQPIYDVLQSPTQKITEEIREEESRLRKSIFKKLNEFSNSSKSELYIRYHSGEKNNDFCNRDEEIKWLKENTNFKISTNDFYEDLYGSKYCIGINTSCLFESFVAGKNVAQVRFKYNEDCYHKMIPIITPETLEETLNNHINNHENLFVDDDVLVSIGNK